MQCLDDLEGNLLRLCLREGSCQVSLKVTVLGVFHGNEKIGIVLKPAVRLHEAVSVLYNGCQ